MSLVIIIVVLVVVGIGMPLTVYSTMNKDIKAQVNVINDLRERVRKAEQFPPRIETVYFVSWTGKITVLPNQELKVSRFEGYETGVAHTPAHFKRDDRHFTLLISNANQNRKGISINEMGFTDPDLAAKQSILNGYRYMIRLLKQQQELNEKMATLEVTMNKGSDMLSDRNKGSDMLSDRAAVLQTIGTLMDLAKETEGWSSELDDLLPNPF